MTISQFHIEFKFRLDKMDALNYPNFLPEEIDLILNNAQDRLIKQRYGFNNAKRQSFEETQKRTEDLKNITENTILTPLAYSVNNIDANARFVNLPTNHWFTIQERAGITCTNCGTPITQRVEVIPITHLEASKSLKDPFAKPNNEKVLRLMIAGKVELISNCTIVDYQLRYLRQPVKMSLSGNITCELSEHIHNELVDTAVSIALEGIEGKRTQSFNPLINNTNE
jgi:hypothetical protein